MVGVEGAHTLMVTELAAGSPPALLPPLRRIIAFCHGRMASCFVSDRNQYQVYLQNK